MILRANDAWLTVASGWAASASSLGSLDGLDFIETPMAHRIFAAVGWAALNAAASTGLRMSA